jgi:hypothetical protein
MTPATLTEEEIDTELTVPVTALHDDTDGDGTDGDDGAGGDDGDGDAGDDDGGADA